VLLDIGKLIAVFLDDFEVSILGDTLGAVVREVY
jgi:hypothetical protein